MLTIIISSVNNKRVLSLLFFISLLLTLTACSPHPGTGKWKADKANELSITTINVLFEGTADFYSEGKDESIRRCFWSAMAQQSMKMQCVFSENTDKKVTYQFVVTEKGHAKLSQDKQIIGLFTLQKPEKEASFF